MWPGKDVIMSESKKVFLSHKSVDKSLVTDFKEVLEIVRQQRTNPG